MGPSKTSIRTFNILAFFLLFSFVHICSEFYQLSREVDCMYAQICDLEDKNNELEKEIEEIKEKLNL